MNKKKVLLIFYILPVLLLPYKISYAQDRINGPMPILSEPICVIDSVLGCFYDSGTKQWAENSNRILFFDEFIKIEFRKLEYEDKDYLVFVKYIEEGYWDYPKLKRGYNSYIQAYFYICDFNEYIKQLNNITNDISTIKLNIISKGDCSVSLLKLYASDNAIRSINNDNPNRDLKYLYLQFHNLPSKNISRFIFYEEYCREGAKFILPSEKNKMLKKGVEPKEFMECSFRLTKSRYEPFDLKLNNSLRNGSVLDICYYETDYYSFNKFIKSSLE